jgi:hypothetical protein
VNECQNGLKFELIMQNISQVAGAGCGVGCRV